jgi:hypothetical protein
MVHFEDVQIQLVDLPPIAREHLDPWLPGLVRGADAAILVVDPTSAAVPDDVEVVRERLAAQYIPLVGTLPEDAGPHDTPLPTLVVFSKADRARIEDVEILQEFYGEFPSVRISALKHTGFEAFKVALWKRLQLVRLT